VPTLQVRDLPERIYRRLAMLAEGESRSIAQQTVVLLEKGLGGRAGGIERRKAILGLIRNMKAPEEAARDLDPAALLREDRER